MKKHFLEIDLVKLVTRKDQNVFAVKWGYVPQALANRIGRPLEPGGVIGCLFRRQDIDKRRAKGTEVIGVFNVAVERSRVVHRQYKHAGNTGVEAVGNGNV